MIQAGCRGRIHATDCGGGGIDTSEGKTGSIHLTGDRPSSNAGVVSTAMTAGAAGISSLGDAGQFGAAACARSNISGADFRSSSRRSRHHPTPDWRAGSSSRGKPSIRILVMTQLPRPRDTFPFMIGRLTFAISQKFRGSFGYSMPYLSKSPCPVPGHSGNGRESQNAQKGSFTDWKTAGKVAANPGQFSERHRSYCPADNAQSTTAVKFGARGESAKCRQSLRAAA